MNLSPLLLVVGPTGSGKTSLGIALCERLGGEIVSADSMQVYRGCDIGTAKATPQEQARARHHLIDIRDPDEEYSAAQWAQDARAAIADIRARDKQPIIVGGTGFYIRALLQPDVLPPVPPDPQLRVQLEMESSAALHEKLARHDSAAATRLHPRDRQRVIRALEIALTASTPQSTPSPEAAPPEYVAFALDVPRALLYERLNRRVDAMLEAGFMEELRALATEYSPAAPALRSLGYKQMQPALSQSALFAEAVELWKRDTRRYAKRQMTWFRHQLPAHRLDATSGASVEQLLALWRG